MLELGWVLDLLQVLRAGSFETPLENNDENFLLSVVMGLCRLSKGNGAERRKRCD